MLTAYPILHHVMFAHDDVSQLCFWMVRLFQIFNQIALLGETFKSMYHLMRTLRPAEHTGMTFFCGQFCISFALCVSFNFWSFSIFLWKLLKLYVCVCVWIWECMWMSVCAHINWVSLSKSVFRMQGRDILWSDVYMLSRFSCVNSVTLGL